MADIRIQLRYNLETGKKDIIIKYDSEDDALPYEHEQRHWEIVEELIGEGIISPDDVGQIRVGKASDQEQTSDQQTPSPQATKSGE